MDTVIKAIGATLISVVFGTILSKSGKDFGILLTIIACAIVMSVAVANLSPVISFIKRLEQIGELNIEIIDILLKCIGISIITEIAILICTDAGQTAMGKALQFLGIAVVLCLAIPVFSGLLDLVEDIIQAI